MVSCVSDFSHIIYLFIYYYYYYYYYLLMPSKLMNERGGTCDLVTPKLCFS